MRYPKVPVLVFLLNIFMLFSCAKPSEETEEKESSEIEATISFTEAPIFHPSHEPKKQDVPFSDAVQVGNTFYLAGQIGMDHERRQLVPGGIVAETKQALENIKEVLAQHNLAMAQVVKTTVILDDISDFKAFNEVYVAYFPQKPARTTFAAQALAAGAKIEIEVVAVRK